MYPDGLLAPVLAGQAICAGRVLLRLAGTARGAHVQVAASTEHVTGSVAFIVPVLDEHARLASCLDGLLAQDATVGAILVADGGSTDGTQALAADYSRRDPRVRLVDAAPVPADWNGKAWGLQAGYQAANPACDWLLTIDADVRSDAALARSLLAFAEQHALDGLSIATEQTLATRAEGLLHPAMLTTLVYRFGAPGRTYTRPHAVQANGQCFLLRRTALDALGGFTCTRASRCEDVTLARALVAKGCAVGFYEAPGLAAVQMYAGWRDAWRNWARSLPLRDQFVPSSWWIGLTEVTLVQALPLALCVLLVAAWRGPESPVAAALLALNLGLLATRLGVLAGTARAYTHRPWTYWLSPLLDLPVAAHLWRSALTRRHVWRGRVLVSEGVRA